MEKGKYPWRDGATPEEKSMLEFTMQQALTGEPVTERHLENPFVYIDTGKMAHFVLEPNEKEKVNLAQFTSENQSNKRQTKVTRPNEITEKEKTIQRK